MLTVILNVIQAIHHMLSRIIFSALYETAYFVLCPSLFAPFVYTLCLDVIRSIYIHIRYFGCCGDCFACYGFVCFSSTADGRRKLFMRLFISKIRVIRGIVMENERWTTNSIIVAGSIGYICLPRVFHLKICLFRNSNSVAWHTEISVPHGNLNVGIFTEINREWMENVLFSVYTL